MGRPALSPDQQKHPIPVRLTEQTISDLDAAAEAEGISRSEFMRQAVERAARAAARKARRLEPAA